MPRHFLVRYTQSLVKTLWVQIRFQPIQLFVFEVFLIFNMSTYPPQIHPYLTLPYLKVVHGLVYGHNQTPIFE